MLFKWIRFETGTILTSSLGVIGNFSSVSEQEVEMFSSFIV